jgi:prepilin-type processing-associated H-X9-DG protein
LGHGTAGNLTKAGPGNGGPWIPFGLGATAAQWRNRRHIRESEIQKADSLFLIVESNQASVGGTTRNYVRAGDGFCYWAYPFHNKKADMVSSTGTNFFADGESNYLYADGHVKALKSLSNPGYTVSWSCFTDNDGGTLYLFQGHAAGFGSWTIASND